MGALNTNLVLVMTMRRSGLFTQAITVLVIFDFGLWTYILSLWGLLDRQLAVTTIVVEVPLGLVLAWLISRFVERSPKELAKGFAEEKQKLEEQAKRKDAALASLKVHYQNLIQRMEQWTYLHSDYGDEMICLATKDEKFGPTRSGTPPNLENDKMHLKEFEKTYGLYLEGKKLSKEYKTKQTETRRLLQTSLQKLLEEKGMTIDEKEQFNLMWWLGIVIEGELSMTVVGGELRTIRIVPIPDDTPPKLFGIRDELKQQEDLRKSIGDKLVVQRKIKDNERKFLSSLWDEVIEPSKESNYSLPQLLNGICDDCNHLKTILA